MTTLKSFNPATGDLVGEVPVTPPDEVPRLVEQARMAQKPWGARTLEERSAHLRPAGEKLVARSSELGSLLTREMGKPLREGIGEVKHCGASLEAVLEEIAASLAPDLIEDEQTRSRVHHDPFGVCAAITPWNFPLAMPHWLVVPALMAGNSVVLKPSEETPLIAQAYADLLDECLPDGVLTVIHGADDQGQALVNAAVDLIAFTGSRETGKHILNAASGTLKRVILELGGKDPLIVLESADVEKAATFAAMNSFRNAGQVCVSTERIYVDESIAARFEEAMARVARDLKVGDGSADGTDIGPMINAGQRAHVLAQVEDAVSHGASVVAGGGGHPDGFIVPTVLKGVTEDMAVMKDETFGPVACIATFSNVEDAIRRANATPFGLGAVVFGAEGEALDVARRLDAGMIGVNKSCGGATGAPWVGAKESGYGYHGSRDGHRQFTQTRVVSLPKQRSS